MPLKFYYSFVEASPVRPSIDGGHSHKSADQWWCAAAVSAIKMLGGACQIRKMQCFRIADSFAKWSGR